MIQFSMSIVTASPATASLERSFSRLGLTYGKPKGLSYICESFKNLIPEITNYLAKYAPYYGHLSEDDYKKLHLVRGGVPVRNWCSVKIQFSMSIVTASPATASLERSFSRLGLTYGELRAQLGHEKAEKLAF